MMKTQATGIPSGNHGLLHRYQIEALTLEGKSSSKYGTKQGFSEMGLLLEGMFRSLNNLLEKFHQSYFFYLLPSTARFVSIGLYMPPFGLVAAGILIKALALRLDTSKLSAKQDEAEEERQKEEGKGDATASSSHTLHVDYSWASTLPILILTHIVGVILYMSPKYFNDLALYMEMKAEDIIFAGILAYFFATLLLPHYIQMKKGNIIQSWHVLKCVTLLELGTLVFAMAFLNFSLAFIITVIYTPICTGISPSHTRFTRWMKGLPIMLASPLAILFLFVTYDTVASFRNIGHVDLLVRAFSATKHSILYSIVDHMIYGNWMLPVACLLFYPIWLQLWIITQIKL